MSMQLVSDLHALKAQVEKLDAELATRALQVAELRKLLEEQTAERRELRRTVAKLEERFLTFDALKEAIAKDAREILHAKRDLIDPTKVRMPQPLKSLGYSPVKL